MVLTMKSKYEDWIKAGRETKEGADADLKKMYTLVDDLKAVSLTHERRLEDTHKFNQKINKLSPQGTWDLLDKQDNDSKIAWKNEDPELSEILKYIAEHPDLKKGERKDNTDL